VAVVIDRRRRGASAVSTSSALLGCLLAGCLGLPAAESAQRFSLAQALQRALGQNPRVQQSLLALAERAEDRRAARSALLPSVAAQAFGQRAKNNLDAFIGTPTPHGPTVVGPFTWGQAGLEARATLFDLSALKRWEASGHAEDAGRAQLEVVREELAALVVGQYLRTLRAGESIRAAQSRVELAQALATLAESQRTQGVATKLDALRAQVQLQTERQRLIQAQTQKTVALAGLGKLLDLPPGAPVELTDSLENPGLAEADGPAVFAPAFEAALRQRPEMLALEARDKAAASLKDAAQGLRWPSLMATGAYNSTGLHSEPWAVTYQFSLGLRVPLFTGGLVSSQVARARVERDQVAAARRDAQGQVGLEVQVAQAELGAARSEVEVAAQALAYAAEALEQARHRFEAGVSSNVELVSAQDELARAQDNRISALYRQQQARADLAKACGRLQSILSK
jgi:outer membrane protein TolC